MQRRRLLRRPIFTTDMHADALDDPPAGVGHNEPPEPVVKLEIPDKYHPLLEHHRFKCFYGGRGGAKSHTFAGVLIAKAHVEKHLILCTRQYQTSIADSVYRVLVNKIHSMGLDAWFEIQKTTIRSKVTGSTFIFKGIHTHPEEIKSLEGVTVCWVEEAQAMTEESWLILEPTIRAEGSEIWVSFNPENKEDATYVRMVLRKPSEDAIVVKVNWRDNPWFGGTLEKQRQWMLNNDADAYDWVWEGNLRKIGDAAVFKNRYAVTNFETPPDVDQFYFGADWGFANDPNVLMRCWIRDECLYVDYEAYGVQVELEDLPFLFAGGKAPISGIEYTGVPEAKRWPIIADSARPETISYVARNGGMNILPAEKWQGSIEDGIAHLKSFKKIYIHERCTNLATEARLYSYKVDEKQLDAEGKPIVLPIVVDKHNHGWDSVRYSLEHFIKGRGRLAVWEKLASGMGVQRRR